MTARITSFREPDYGPVLGPDPTITYDLLEGAFGEFRLDELGLGSLGRLGDGGIEHQARGFNIA